MSEVVIIGSTIILHLRVSYENQVVQALKRNHVARRLSTHHLLVRSGGLDFFLGVVRSVTMVTTREMCRN